MHSKVKKDFQLMVDGNIEINSNKKVTITGKDGVKIDDLFNGDGEAARHARQIFGAASRIARAKSTIGKEVLVVTDMDTLNGPFMFAKRSALGRLVYPQVADKEVKSDGYFVTGVHGWPANDNGLAMAHVFGRLMHINGTTLPYAPALLNSGYEFLDAGCHRTQHGLPAAGHYKGESLL